MTGSLELARTVVDELLRGGVREATPVAFYELAVFAWEHALQREAAALLGKAYDLAEAKKQDLVLVVYNDQAGRLLGHARWYDTVGRGEWAKRYCDDIVRFYPESDVCDDAKALLARLNGETAAAPRTFEVKTSEPEKAPPKPEPGEEGPIKVRPPDPREREPSVEVRVQSMGPELAAADAAFKAGMEAYMEGLRLHRDGGNFVAKMREARRHFGKALPLYQKAAEREPGNGRLQKRAQEIGFYYHQCGRMLPI